MYHASRAGNRGGYPDFSETAMGQQGLERRFRERASGANFN